ncbi:THO complex subunit 2-like [Haliotis rufescens]|uniref:THO complex subunit 2-like n=1 Tax=Haliotis rufescens TaxID=6454 RepID=UPI001EB0859B|nr:THO complex subunit 2-like [Haliotis rufescens]
MASICISADACKAWEKTGKSEFVKQCRKLQSENSGLWEPEKNAMKRAVYELCWSVLRGHLKQDQALAALADLNDHMRNVYSLLADTIAVIDVETSCNEDKTQRDRFITFVRASAGLITEPVLKERLDQETLEAVGLIFSKLQFQQKYVKTKTKLYYKQQKFNLLREESEGYSKLVTELNQEVPTNVTYQQVLENIKSLIGCFDLDPNRVLDIMLEAFECRPEQESFYIPLFKDYVTDKLTLCHILGFRFHEQNQEIDSTASLFRVAALLLRHNLVHLEDLYPHLLPSDSDIIAFHEKELADAKAYQRKLNIVSLSDRKDDDKDKDDMVNIDLRTNNQKIGLCEALLAIGAWDNAKAVLDRMPEFFAMSNTSTAQALCQLIHSLVEPLYQHNSGLSRVLMKKRDRRWKGKISPDAVTTFLQLHQRVMPMFLYLGPHASRDPILIAKFIRLGRTFMTKRHEGGVGPEDDVAYYGFLNILDDVVLPSMCLLPCNCCLTEELWGLLKLYKYELRYRLYGHWKNDSHQHHAILIRRRADCLERAKYIMKRLSKETVKPSGRQIGKLSHSNPGVVFEYVLSQIQRYDNFIGPVVDSLKFLTSFSYDVLAFCIIEAVASPEKERMKHDDTNISLWLQSLANFAGCICRKYQVELAGIMQYVANKLKAGKSIDLLLLREVVQKMTGVEISEEITNDQLEAMTGGELLRQEGGYFAQVRNTKKSSTRLKETLLEHDLALSLCLLMSQQRNCVVFKEGSNRHLKLVGKLYDQCQDTLVQFGSFLSMQLSTEEFVKRLPSIDVLMTTFHLPADSAFFLSRSLYAHGINAKYEEKRKSDKGQKSSSQTKIQRYIEASEEVLKPTIDLVQSLYPGKVWEDISPQFYLTFWSLSMYDLAAPTPAYEKQIQQLNSQINAIDDNRDMPQSKKKKEKERCNNLMEKLKEEEKKQNEHVNRVMARLQHERDHWFLSREGSKSEAITEVLQLCIFPRCCFTASDAVFCAKFIHVLHELKTPHFSTLICYDRIFCDITYTVTSCTENEASRYGRFLCAALDTIMKWHSDSAIFEKECFGYPGFVTVFRKATKDKENSNKADGLDFENYRHVCHKWHFRLTKAMVACLESQNYIQIRNALIILTKILPHYPRIMQFGQALERRVDRLSKDEKDKRPDIYALAMGYSGQLKSKKQQWMPETRFHIKDVEAKKAAQAAAANGSGMRTDVAKDAKKRESNGGMKDGKENKDIKQGKESGEKGDKPEKKDKSEKKEKKDGKSKSDKKSPDEGKDTSSSKSSSSKDKEIVKEKSHKDKSGERTKDKSMTKEERAEAKAARENGKSEKKKSEKKSKEEKGSKVKREKEDGDRSEKEESRSSLSKEPGERVDERIISTGSSLRHSTDNSPRYGDERDSKRRKIDVSSSGSKEAVHEGKSKHKRSPSYEREKEIYREKEKKERKRDHSLEMDNETKRRRSEDYTKTSKLNGEPDRRRSKSREHSWERSSPSMPRRGNRDVFDSDESPAKSKAKVKKEKTSSSKKK